MISKRDSLLWKFEHDANICAVHVEDYLMHPNLSILRGKVDITTRHFRGSFPVNLCYDDVLDFTRQCNSLSSQIEASGDSLLVATYGVMSQSSLQIEAKCDGEHRVLWAVQCQPAVQGRELLSVAFSTSSQLLRSVENGVDRIWRRWPGGKTTAPPI